MAALLEPLGIVKAPELRRAKTRMPALLRPRDSLDQEYTLELWTQSPTTRQAILDTIARHLGFSSDSDGDTQTRRSRGQSGSPAPSRSPSPSATSEPLPPASLDPPRATRPQSRRTA
jgi:hypothetical protein